MKKSRPALDTLGEKSPVWYKKLFFYVVSFPVIVLIVAVFYFGLPKAIGTGGQAQTAGCATVTFAETGWTDISATTAVSKQILEALGYQTKSYLLSVPVAFNAMSTGEIDVFLGFWQPSMNADIKPFLERGDVSISQVNLQGAKYGLAVPQYLYDQGLKSFADIGNFEKALDGKIYGVEPGNDANRIVLSHIEENSYNLKNFQIVESSEQAMLSEVDAAIQDHRPIVFLAWQPHPMNDKFKIAYLKDEGNWFKAGDEGASVATVIRRGYQQECPNVSQLLQNLSFNIKMEDKLMGDILNQGQTPDAAARAWLQQNPSVWQKWLQGVKTLSGEDGLEATKKALIK